MTARGRAVLLTLALLPLLGVERPPGLGDVAEVRHWSYPEFTRVVVELSRGVRPEVHRLAADAKAERPERLYLDLGGIWVGRRFGDPIPVGDGLLRGVRLGQNTLHKTRVVIDLERYTHHRLLVLSAPDRVVVDVYGPRDGTAPGEPGRRTGRLPIELRPVRTVVLDAGHGGNDPGAIGRTGLREKDVTLALARNLRRRLEERGLRVVLTRDGDRTLSLEERTAIAEGAGGDLFVSLHANASPRRGVEGIETYYLDEGYERHSITVAARENGIPRQKVDDLQRTLARFRVSAVSNHSAKLAGTVHREIISGVRSGYGKVTDLGVKRGPFYVLFLSSMPSVLIEVGFVTNGKEAKRLRDARYLDVVASRIATGLVRYRDAQVPVVAVGEQQ